MRLEWASLSTFVSVVESLPFGVNLVHSSSHATVACHVHLHQTARLCAQCDRVCWSPGSTSSDERGASKWIGISSVWSLPVRLNEVVRSTIHWIQISFCVREEPSEHHQMSHEFWCHWLFGFNFWQMQNFKIVTNLTLDRKIRAHHSAKFYFSEWLYGIFQVTFLRSSQDFVLNNDQCGAEWRQYDLFQNSRKRRNNH